MKEKWIETSVKYDKTMEDGSMKSVTEKYLVSALSFTEAETNITEEMKHYISGDFSVDAVRTARYAEVFASKDSEADYWYKVQVAVIDLDEKTGKEKRHSLKFLVQAKTVRGALQLVDEEFGKTLMEYEVEAVALTKIFDIFGLKENKGGE
ncbi:DUF4494 domain-containing protein [Prevotella melaninogenica]|uniref:DUF4494 domain-containing protein n=1 Tax=Prevotella melaninogenica TaxID=28132 RepID=A0ABS6Y5Q0_9BACT|nr:DUF4494 domain-containing protein [Prevotella melaninogenica]MBW4754817.1 DUF4494 domain-containing protein [Prevotella melaninogenica]